MSVNVCFELPGTTPNSPKPLEPHRWQTSQFSVLESTLNAMADEVYFYTMCGFLTAAYLAVVGFQLKHANAPIKDKNVKNMTITTRGRIFLAVLVQLSTFALWCFSIYHIYAVNIQPNLGFNIDSTYYAFFSWTFSVVFALLMIATWVYNEYMASPKGLVPYNVWLIPYFTANASLKIAHDVVNMQNKELRISGWYIGDLIGIGLLIVVTLAQMWRLSNEKDNRRSFLAETLAMTAKYEGNIYLPTGMQLHQFQLYNLYDTQLWLAWFLIQAFAGLTYFKVVQQFGFYITFVGLIPMLFPSHYWIHMQILCEEAFWTAYWVIPTIGVGSTSDLTYTLARNTTLTDEDILSSISLFSVLSATALPVYLLYMVVEKCKRRV